MDILLLFKALLLGIVEGLTEFLPVSSTGHLIIVGDLLNFNDERGKVFEIAIQLGAILAVCWEYRSKISAVVTGLLQYDKASQRFAANILIAFTPAVILGLLFHSTIKTYLFNPFTVAGALIVGGFIILWVEHHYKERHHIAEVDQMSWKDALKVGFAQCLAMFPGVSRSGATIMGGLIFGLSRHTATQFSFFLAIPTMLAATSYDVYKNAGLLQLSDLPMFVTGFVAAFATALLVVRGLLHYVAHHTFAVFAWYRIVFGLLVLLSAQLGWIDWG